MTGTTRTALPFDNSDRISTSKRSAEVGNSTWWAWFFSSTSDRQQCEHLYGSGDLYAVSKRQIPSREIKTHRLR
jgi:hypothetical protein